MPNGVEGVLSMNVRATFLLIMLCSILAAPGENFIFKPQNHIRRELGML